MIPIGCDKKYTNTYRDCDTKTIETKLKTKETKKRMFTLLVSN